MEPTYYVRLLKRRWRLLVLATAAGIALGYSSNILTGDSGADEAFFAATHTLVAEDTVEPERGGGRDMAINYDQLAYFARLGQVPDEVAERLGGDPIRLASRVALTPVPAGNALEITATGTNPDDIEELADVYAVVLLEFLVEREQESVEGQIAAKEAEVEELDARLADLRSQVLAGGDVAVLDLQINELVQQVAAARNELDNLRAREGVSIPLTTLQSASAVEISAEEYAAQLANITARDSDVISARDAQLRAATGTSDSTSPLLRTGMGGVLGFIIGAVSVLLLDRLDPRLRGREELEQAYGLPVISEIPTITRAQQSAGVVSFTQPRSRVAEAFRLLRSALLFARVQVTESGGNGTNGHAEEAQEGTEHQALVVLISSPGPGEGKTTVTANLAAVFAEAGNRVLALNCDYRRPKLHEQLEVPFEPRRVHECHIPDVHVIVDVVEDAIHANPADVVRAQAEVVEQARHMFDIILIDTAPLLTVNDAAEILPVADMVVMVARAGRTTHDAAFRASELLERRAAKAVGGVLIGGEDGASSRYYYYYRGDYYHEEAPEQVEPLRHDPDKPEAREEQGEPDQAPRPTS